MHPERTPSGPSSLIAGRQQLANRNPAGTLAKLPDARQGFVYLFLAPVGLGHDPGDAAPVTGNNQRCAPLHFIQELRKMNLGFRGLNFAHRINQSIRPVLLYHFASYPARTSAGGAWALLTGLPIETFTIHPAREDCRRTASPQVGGRTPASAQSRRDAGRCDAAAQSTALQVDDKNPALPGDERCRAGWPRSPSFSDPFPWHPARWCGPLR